MLAAQQMAVKQSNLEALEQRALFSVTWNITLNDPGELYSAYHSKLVSFAQAAGNDWAKLLTSSNASIELQINLVDNISTAAGDSATTVQIGQVEGLNLREQGVTYEIRTGNDPNGVAVDAQLNINAQYMVDELYFDPGSNPASRTGSVPGNKTDAYSTILHEFGHILAWNGFRDYSSGALAGNDESTFDQFVTQIATDFFFIGPRATDAYGGNVPLTHGNLYHLGNDDPRPGTDLIAQLMNGVAFFFGTKYDFSPLDIAIIQDIGLPTRTAAPLVSAQDFDYLAKPSVSWTFNAPVRWELSIADITLTRRDSNTIIPSNNLSLAYDRGTDTARLTYTANNGILGDGDYRATLSNAAVRDLLGNQLDQTYTLDFFVFAGDANHDRVVDTRDFNALAGQFGGTNQNFAQGDFNYDGLVNSMDFNIFTGQYGHRLSLPAPAIATPPIFAVAALNSPDIKDVMGMIA